MDNSICQFPKTSAPTEKCGLHFRNMYELIHHIEEDHIPLVEKERASEFEKIKELRKNGQQNEYEKSLTALSNKPIPLSLFCRLRPFPKGHKVTPIQSKPKTLKFCHYRKQPEAAPVNAQGSQVQSQSQLLNNPYTSTQMSKPFDTGLYLNKTISPNLKAPERIPLAETKRLNLDLDDKDDKDFSGQSGSQTDEAKKHRCEFAGCGRTYKNLQGLKAHKRTSHSSSTLGFCGNNFYPNSHQSRLSPFEEGILSRQLLGAFNANLTTTSNAVPTPIQNSQVATVSQTAIHADPTNPSNVPVKDECVTNVLPNINDNFTNISAIVTDDKVKAHTSSDEKPSESTEKDLLQQSSISASNNQQEEMESSTSSSTTPVSLGISSITSTSPLRLASIGNKYNCHLCTKTYKSQVNLNKHLADAHGGSRLAPNTPTSSIQVVSSSESPGTPLLMDQQRYYQTTTQPIAEGVPHGRRGGNIVVYQTQRTPTHHQPASTQIASASAPNNQGQQQLVTSYTVVSTQQPAVLQAPQMEYQRTSPYAQRQSSASIAAILNASDSSASYNNQQRQQLTYMYQQSQPNRQNYEYSASSTQQPIQHAQQYGTVGASPAQQPYTITPAHHIQRTRYTQQQQPQQYYQHQPQQPIQQSHSYVNYAQQQHGISGTQQQQQQQQTATYYQPVRIIQAHSQQYRYQNQQHDAPHHSISQSQHSMGASRTINPIEYGRDSTGNSVYQRISGQNYEVQTMQQPQSQYMIAPHVQQPFNNNLYR